ncbi:phosphate transporter family protein [Geothermobacter ehrlichii]|uniref:Phosphate transporter n=1 Tax=Geothermobacter ehrlichii TaxID=213224 RepID=A0A5D3WJF4_9BACT|nr:inorganic phosphate transporter [Geothermobacter ehrlichii]TYO99056.1 phosphate transporter family protein [Geothermobacter ehrlichii]
MGTEFFAVGVGILILIATLDLVVGVSNDAVNFINSPIGARVASRNVILTVAAFGLLAGVLFSSGMMEVARKGIFHPEFFTMPELLTIFLAVMISDIILLDLFNTYGLPTSTTVSVVFELLGAAVVVSLLKIVDAGDSLATIGQYINSAKAIAIIMGILFSVAVAFVCGAIVQFLTRLLFTFDYQKRMRRYGAIWGGIAMASITYFILIKGAKGASFMTGENIAWIKGHGPLLMGAIFVVSAVVLQILQSLKVNILKPIILVGTFALALAFAANDLVNFIGVPMAGLHAFKAAMASADPLHVTMGALSRKVPSETSYLLVAGAIMVATLFLSRKARSVTETTIQLSQQEEGVERFESIGLSRAIVRLVLYFSDSIRVLIPAPIRRWIGERFDTENIPQVQGAGGRPSFDLIRASVNLMVASAVISYATANKLPLSTTYVTFMVAMGTSFADRAWGRESAVYRVTGVLTVIGGWFMTAVIAFTFAGIFAAIIFYTKGVGVILLLVLAAVLIYNAHRKHRQMEEQSKKQAIFNLESVEDANTAIATTFEHMSLLLKELADSLDATLDALFKGNFDRIGYERKKLTQYQQWSNIISANIFKAMRLLAQKGMRISHKYAQTVRRLQKLTDGHRDIVLRAYTHVGNQHKGLLPEQIEELQQVREQIRAILLDVADMISRGRIADLGGIEEKDLQLRQLAAELNEKQVERIKDNTSKTRLSILYYGIIGNAMMISKQNLELLEIFNESFSGIQSPGTDGPSS